MPEEFTKVKIIKDGEEEGEAVEVFQSFRDKSGMVPNWARVMAHRPEVLTAFTKLLSVTMGPGLVEQDNKWKVAYKVSEMNKCTYCIGVVEGMLKKLGVSEEDMKYVLEDVDKMKSDEKAAVKYAEAVTKNAVEVPDKIYEELKKHYKEAQIVELSSAIGLFNYINRFNDALGVVPEV
jgi:uncharacterized peroxidase-related enzyme